MDKSGYISMEEMSKSPPKANLERWLKAYRQTWKLVDITHTPLSVAKKVVCGKWDDRERRKFETWVTYYENMDDLKYKKVSSFSDCDFESMKKVAMIQVATVDEYHRDKYLKRILMINNTRTMADIVKAIVALKNSALTKTAAERDRESASRMFKLVRDIHSEISKKKLVRNLARVLSMDVDGSFPEVAQSLSKLIDAYTYATSRVQDVLSRLGLQLSVLEKGEESEGPSKMEEPYSKEEEVEGDKVLERHNVKEKSINVIEPSERPAKEERGTKPEKFPGEVPRVPYRGV